MVEKHCPKCKMMIDEGAEICPHCRHKFGISIRTGCLIILALIIFVPAILGGLLNDYWSYTPGVTSEKEEELPSINISLGMSTEQLKAATNKLIKRVDKVEDITWYYHKDSPMYRNSYTAIFAYFGKKDSTVYNARLKIQYVADDWLFIKRYVIKTDKNKYYLEPGPFGVETDSGIRSNGEVGIWEWYDKDMSRNDLKILLDIIKSKETMIRFEGRQYSKDKKVSQKQKRALKETLAAWTYMGGVPYKY